MPTKPRFLRVFSAEAALVVLSLAVSLIAVEALYRGWLSYELHLTIPALDESLAENFSAVDASYLEEDRTYGYHWRVGNRTYLTAYVKDATFDRCEPDHFLAATPNSPGPRAADPATAALRILVFGDSFTTAVRGGETWPHLAEQMLTRRFGYPVSLVNVSRGGYGVLQMVDQAAHLVPQLRPDVYVIAYITNDLVRPRWWILDRALRGRERQLLSLSPDDEADPRKSAAVSDYLQINPAITEDWCRRMTAAKASGDTAALRDDPVVRSLLAQRRDIVFDYRYPVFTVDFWTLRRSFAWNLLRHRDPYYGVQRIEARAGVRKIDIMDFNEDEQYRHDIAVLKQTGVPIFLVHIVHEYEIEEQREYDYVRAGGTNDAQGESLRHSLEATFGTPTIPLLSSLFAPWRADPLAYMWRPPEDMHPNRKGIGTIAAAVADGLVQHGIAKFAHPERTAEHAQRP